MEHSSPASHGRRSCCWQVPRRPARWTVAVGGPRPLANQWYGREGVHKPKFITAFVKGPPDKPFKDPGTKLFIAAR